MKHYKLYITTYYSSKIVNKYDVIEKDIYTNDIYHEIGWIYCNTIDEIKRIDICIIDNKKEK